jgi:DNA-binding XRE family transcriptional regulator
MKENQNPFLLARKELHLTQSSVAALCNIQRHVVIRTEQGLYETPSPKLCTVLELDYLPTVAAYHKWRIYSRVQNSEKIRNYFSLYLAADIRYTNIHPHIVFREINNISSIGLCILIKFQHSLLNKYENGKETKFPSLLERAYLDCGISLRRLSDCESRFGRTFIS